MTQITTKSPSKTIQKADKMLRYFKDAPPKVYKVDKDQVEIIKLFWRELHNHTGCQFTFNDDYTKLRKDLNND